MGAGHLMQPAPGRLAMQTQIVGCLPNAPMIMGHIGVTVAKRSEGILGSVPAGGEMTL
tara:strand:+ start:1896 stop:2069 length:174 start_codon:yes stop_codon:yes gene_type:complete